MKKIVSKLFTILFMALIIVICLGAYNYVIVLEDARNELENVITIEDRERMEIKNQY